MGIKVIIPTPLRQFTDGKSEIEVEASTAGEALEKLTAEHGELRKHLYKDDELRSFVNVYVGEEDIRDLDGTDTKVADGSEVLIVPSIAGGNIAAEAKAESSLPELSKEEIARYSRHLILPEVGLEGQRKLKNARILMIGAGGLGSPLGLYLAAAGIGTIGIVDMDVVDESNLQRQIIHGTKDVGRAKIASAKDRLEDINPNTKVEAFETQLTSENALELFKDFDVIADGTDNFPTRYLVNDAAVLTGKPNVYGSIFRFEGQASVFWAEKGACYRCLYPEPPPPGLVPSCAEGGVLGVLPGIVGSIQANETIKVILGAEGILLNRLLLFDAWQMNFRQVKLRKNPDCPVCGTNPTVTELIDYQEFCGLPNADATQEKESDLEEITATELKKRLDAGEDLQLIDVREPHEYEIAKIPNTKLIPLGDVVKRRDEIDETRTTVVNCKGGVRSAKAIKALQEDDFTGKLINLKGGIGAWSDEVDASVPKY
ncbi:MAG: molybdopterin-synthase adenylyltransferase MoeB [Acidobacteriota bacterium]|nr:molybdopterin-synthase adenylyltransferase MoeB [Acidobacteriota bacterium]